MADAKKDKAQAAQTEEATGGEDAFESLMSRVVTDFKPRTDSQKDRIQTAVANLAKEIVADENIIVDDAVNTINAIIAEIDLKLSQTVNKVLHHPEFQQLESAWRGLNYLVNNTQTDKMLKIKFMPISKDELRKTLKRFPGVAWDQSPLHKRIYEEGLGTLGADPYGCLIGDYSFDHSAPDVEILEGMSKIAAAAHAPFVTSASPGLLQMDSWQELTNPRDITKIFSTDEYARWRSLRESDDSRYLGLTMPRFLARMPYGAQTNPVDGFEFEEETELGDSSHYCWANAAYAMGVNINRAFKQYGWCTTIRGVESGGTVEGLPVHTFPSIDGGVDMKCPTEISIPDRRDKELSDNGFMALCHRKGTDNATFIAAQSLQKPEEFEDPDATANAQLSARLPYLFATCRFAHYLKCIVRDKVGGFAERADMEKFLNDWILNYVDATPHADERVRARKPLSAAQVTVNEVEGNPGYYTSVFHLRPHFQLEGLKVSLRLVSKLPAAGGG